MCMFFIFISIALANKTLHVAVENWPPFIFANNDITKKITGIDIDILEEIAKRLDLKLKISQYPWSRSLLMLKEGKIDGITSIAQNQKRKKYVAYTSIPYYTLSTRFYVLKGNSNLIKKYEDLYKFNIGVVQNSLYFKQFDNDSEIKKTSVTREIQLLRMLDIKRFQVFIGTDAQVDYQVAQSQYKRKFEKAVYRPNNNVNLFIAFSRKSPFASRSNIKAFDKVILDLKKEGIIKKIAARYFK